MLPTRPSTGAQVDIDPKYMSAPRFTIKDGSKSSVPNRQNNSGRPESSTGLPTYAKVDKSQGKSAKGIGAGSKPRIAQKPLSKSKTSPEQSKSPPPPYETIDETSESRRKSDNLPAYDSVGETLGLGDDVAVSNGIEDATGKENAYDLLNPETMNIGNHSTQQSSAVSQDEPVGDFSLYDMPAAPSPSTSQEARSLGELAAYGVTDLSKKDLSRGEIEVKQNGQSMNSSATNMEVPAINHHYETLENPNDDV